jgi:hypothetical protein
VYIAFSRAWWNINTETKSNIQTHRIQQAETTPNVTATTVPIHQYPDPAELQSKQQFPGFARWQAPSYAKDLNPNEWTQECINFAALPGEQGHPTLLFYTFGQTSMHLAELARSADSQEQLKKKLDNFFRPYYSLLPNFDSANPEHTPQDVLFTNWTGDELAGFGSYCNFQVGLEHGSSDIEAMREGLPERRIWIAGEHTAPFVEP